MLRKNHQMLHHAVASMVHHRACDAAEFAPHDASQQRITTFCSLLDCVQQAEACMSSLPYLKCALTAAHSLAASLVAWRL
jgi:hypothetical protein